MEIVIPWFCQQIQNSHTSQHWQYYSSNVEHSTHDEKYPQPSVTSSAFQVAVSSTYYVNFSSNGAFWGTYYIISLRKEWASFEFHLLSDVRAFQERVCTLYFSNTTDSKEKTLKPLLQCSNSFGIKSRVAHSKCLSWRRYFAP